MKKQLQYYMKVVPVSPQRHGDWSLEARSDYEFSGHSNSVPLTAPEIPAAALEYAVVFTGTEEAVQPAVILGLKPDENLYLDAQNQWNAKYIPAFVRRYPFVFSKSEVGDKFTLCIDEAYANWNQAGSGQRLFDENGQGTAYLDKIFNFVKDYQRQLDRTQVFCQKFKQFDLLEPMTARFKLPSGEKAQLTGFMAIDRDKLNALSSVTLGELAKTGELELMYLHLQSMRNFSAMVARVRGEEAVEHPPEECLH